MFCCIDVGCVSLFQTLGDKRVRKGSFFVISLASWGNTVACLLRISQQVVPLVDPCVVSYTQKLIQEANFCVYFWRQAFETVYVNQRVYLERFRTLGLFAPMYLFSWTPPFPALFNKGGECKVHPESP